MDFGFSPIPIFDLLASPAHRPVSTMCALVYSPILFRVGAVKGGGTGNLNGLEIQSILIIRN
jgi:hypothetical protein